MKLPAWILAATLLVCASHARADTRDALALARVCYSEAGLEEGPDCAAILSALRNRAEKLRMSFGAMIRTYAANTFRLSRRDSRRWLAHLDASGTQPEGWPEHVAWSNHRDRWLALIDRATALLEQPSEYPTAQHWGMTTGEDLRRAIRAGWVRVVIDGARNAFWAFPSDRE